MDNPDSKNTFNAKLVGRALPTELVRHTGEGRYPVSFYGFRITRYALPGMTGEDISKPFPGKNTVILRLDRGIQRILSLTYELGDYPIKSSNGDSATLWNTPPSPQKTQRTFPLTPYNYPANHSPHLKYYSL